MTSSDPGSVITLQSPGLVDPSPYALGGFEGYRGPAYLTIEACDLDGDGLPELISGSGTWDGRDLMSPGALPIGPGAFAAACAGDLDGVTGDELLEGGT